MAETRIKYSHFLTTICYLEIYHELKLEKLVEMFLLILRLSKSTN